ncbi:tetratricopeptide repeat protein [Celerinatantimonas diazotrophica]|uniref:Tetratricopeptide repeat protein n=1 Tax=Celerinatantimonas diazotrophica TaxID=412034 RepID=A0A4R1JLP0_9GAMM|nr:hypothetical protein [Celerinatantimonas diazotrophica]TCK51953.1 hypothetical protein EV690_2046 [Celerinatantimonas diazotrophica]CAG9296348.1 hypothetical protein CEDIAZO_01497 [Celerinatantimonas diazotrophica]
MLEKKSALLGWGLLSLGLYSPLSVNAATTMCQQFGTYQSKGLQAYGDHDYTQARRYFEYQAILAEICPAYHLQKPIAYNNIALTYFHQQHYLTANAWLELAPKSKQSKLNAHIYANQIEQAQKNAQKSINGQYWSYVGQGAWNRIDVVKTANHQADISFSGMSPGRNILEYGPHMGDLTTRITIEDHQGTYQSAHSECKIHFRFLPNELVVKQATTRCSFGAGVNATGDYQKVDPHSEDG